MEICKDYEALLDLYVDGKLEPEEMLRVQGHLDHCAACRRYVDDALAIRAAFPDADSAPLPAGFHEAVMARVAQAPAPKRKSRSLWALPTVAAACLALVVAVQGGGLSAKKEAAPAAQYNVAAASAPAARYKAIAASAPAAAEAPAPQAQAAPKAYEYAADSVTESCLLEDGKSSSGDGYFDTLTITPQQAQAHLSGFVPITLEDGRCAYELVARDYETLLQALEESAEKGKTESFSVSASGLALAIVEE